MEGIRIIERDMTQEEFEQMNAGFDDHTLASGAKIQTSERMGFVALDGERFIGCSSGLAYKNGDAYNGWFYLTDLFVERAYRRQGIGSALLQALEAKLPPHGIRKIYTWTAGYEGPGFYRKMGYTVFTELEGWYSNGASRVGMRKEMKPQSL